tara:strand:+ start:6241 stop:6981 length:741 start_codon:yes stop_codon:yes gene_type:complete
MAQKNKETLKNYFKKGGFVTEKQFIDLIDSSMNVVDDGIAIKPKDGLRLNPIGIFSKLMSFFKKKSQNTPNFSLNINHNNSDGLSINNSEDKSLLKIKEDGNIGINTENPGYSLHVNGTLGVNSRIGTYRRGAVSADGRWHKVVSDLDGINAFEVVAQVSGQLNSGNYCMSHAIALSTFGGKMSLQSIKVSSAKWGWFSFRNKIQFRWTGTLHNYHLELRTVKNWGRNPETDDFYKIKFNVTKINE